MVGNGQYVNVLFVPEIHDNVNMLLSIKNVHEIESVIKMKEFCLNFLNRSILFFPKNQVILKQKGQRLILVDVPFMDEISGLVIVKFLDSNAGHTTVFLLQFTRNTKFVMWLLILRLQSFLEKDEAIGVVEERSIEYYKIKQGIFTENLSTYYEFWSTESLCKEFNKFMNTFQKEVQECTDPNPWSANDDERRHWQVNFGENMSI